MMIAMGIYAATTWPDVMLEIIRVVPPTAASLAAAWVGVSGRRIGQDTQTITRNTNMVAHETNTVVNDRLHGTPTMSQDVKELRERSDKGEARRKEGRVDNLVDDIDLLVVRSDEGEDRRAGGLPPEGGPHSGSGVAPEPTPANPPSAGPNLEESLHGEEEG